MTPADLADLHARVFTVPRPFSEEEFAELLAEPNVFCISELGGFAIGRVIVDEAEVLTLAVDPTLRRQGKGRRLTTALMDQAKALACQVWKAKMMRMVTLLSPSPVEFSYYRRPAAGDN